MLLQHDFTQPLSMKLKAASLWNLSDNQIDWLIDTHRGTQSFLQILAIILPRLRPTRQAKIWNKLKDDYADYEYNYDFGSNDNENPKPNELSTFEDALKANARRILEWNDDKYEWEFEWAHNALAKTVQESKKQKLEVASLGMLYL